MNKERGGERGFFGRGATGSCRMTRNCRGGDVPLQKRERPAGSRKKKWEVFTNSLRRIPPRVPFAILAGGGKEGKKKGEERGKYHKGNHEINKNREARPIYTTIWIRKSTEGHALGKKGGKKKKERSLHEAEG